MSHIRPSSKVLFCKPEEVVTKTTSGILLTEEAAVKSYFAEVITVGSEVKDYKPKDRIVYKTYTVTDITLDRTEYFLINEEDVLGVVVE